MTARLSAPETAARHLTVTRLIDAPRALVFRAWTESAQVAHWWGPRGFTTLSCEMDIRPGGSYRFSMRSPEGTVHRKQGVYREIVAPERIAFTFAWEDAEGRPGHQTLVTVTFAEQGTQTLLTLHQALFDTTEARDGHQGGWTSCLGRFAEYLASI
jgi:uncharacterized protein YndB with AHSA1/START domain